MDELGQRSDISGNGNRSRLNSGGNLSNFGKGTRRAAETPGTPALLAAQPLKWIHIPKCGTSLLNALIHLPGVCPGVDDSFQVNSDVLGHHFEANFDKACQYVCDGTKFVCATLVNGLYRPHRGIGIEYDFLKGRQVFINLHVKTPGNLKQYSLPARKPRKPRLGPLMCFGQLEAVSRSPVVHRIKNMQRASTHTHTCTCT